MTEEFAAAEIEIQAGSREDTGGVYAALRGRSGITVRAIPAARLPGEQGVALDVLMVGLSSGAVTAFLQIIKTLAESRGPKFVLKIRRGKDKLEVTADNVDDVIPVLRELMRGS
jgi:hypothetical protein